MTAAAGLRVLHDDGTRCRHRGPFVAGDPPQCAGGHLLTHVQVGTQVLTFGAVAQLFRAWAEAYIPLLEAFGGSFTVPGPRQPDGDPCGPLNAFPVQAGCEREQGPASLDRCRGA